MFKSLKTTAAVFSLLLLIVGTTSVFAASPSPAMVCEQTYSVQADDWLSKLADKFYGDIYAYPAIVDATELLGWQPVIDLDEALRLTVEGFIKEYGKTAKRAAGSATIHK